jgi:hypothetical protein
MHAKIGIIVKKLQRKMDGRDIETFIINMFLFKFFIKISFYYKILFIFMELDLSDLR